MYYELGEKRVRERVLDESFKELYILMKWIRSLIFIMTAVENL